MNTNFNGSVNNFTINNHVTTNNINRGSGRSNNLGGLFIPANASTDSPLLETVVQIGQDDLPILPNYDIPRLKKDITVSHCRKPEVYTYFWVLDPEQRGSCKTSHLNNEASGKVYQRLLTHLYGNILTEGMRQTENTLG